MRQKINMKRYVEAEGEAAMGELLEAFCAAGGDVILGCLTDPADVTMDEFLSALNSDISVTYWDARHDEVEAVGAALRQNEQQFADVLAGLLVTWVGLLQ